MTIENDKKYKLTGEQIKDLASRFGVLSGEIGDLSSLTTTDKSNLVAAINEAATGGGGVTELTTADYNYPTTGTATSVALWLLEPGMYHWAQGVSTSCYYSHATSNAGNATVYGAVSNGAHVPIVYNLGSQYDTYIVYASKATGSAAVGPTAIATDSLVFADPSTKEKIQIGVNANTSGTQAVGVGAASYAPSNGAVSIGYAARADKARSVALGWYSKVSAAGEVGIGLQDTAAGNGYNNSNYRLLTGLYDPQSDHDAATKGYVDGLVGNIASALNAINNGTGA